MLQLKQLDFVEKAELPEPVLHHDQVANLTRNLLVSLGEDPSREGLQQTPARVARMYEAFLRPIARPVMN